MAHLEHLFVAGVRFDTQVQYLVYGADPAYENLPTHESASSRSCAAVSMVQCLAVLGQLPRKQVKALTRVAHKVLPESMEGPDDEGMLRSIDALGTPTVAQLHRAAGGEDLGMVAQNALRSGQVCMLCFESALFCRWAPVIGVELDRCTGQTRALLLLDASKSQPWACAHNARIELRAVVGRPVRSTPGFTLTCRHLTGEARSIRLRSMIVLRRKPAPN